MSRFVDIECTAVKEVIGRRKFESIEDIQEFLDNIPTADVVEAKHGEWITKENTHTSRRGRLITYDTYKCSVCYLRNGRHKPNYCPNCGAKMYGGKYV